MIKEFKFHWRENFALLEGQEVDRQGCTKFGILVSGLPAKHKFGSQFLAGLKAHAAESSLSPSQSSLITASQPNKPASIRTPSQHNNMPDKSQQINTNHTVQQPARLTTAPASNIQKA